MLTVDVSGFRLRVRNGEQRLPAMLKRDGDFALERLALRMQTELEASRKGDEGDTLFDAIADGGSSRATAQGVKFNHTITDKKVPYANIQDKGGFIKSKGKMPFKLFRLAKELRDERYRIIGAAALRDGGVTIKAKLYYTNGVKQFIAQDAALIKERFRTSIITAYQS